MQSTPQILTSIGCILLLSLVTHYVGQRTLIPRATLLIILGIIIGKQGLNVIPSAIENNYELIANVTLLMVGFLLGGQLNLDYLKKLGGKIFWISLFAALGAIICVFFGLLWAGAPIVVAVLLACISSSTAPAATADVINELNDKGNFSKMILSIVAIDDVLGLIFFSLGLAALAFIQHTHGVMEPLIIAIREIGGALLLGALIGWPAAYLTGRIDKGRPMLIEALGLVLLCGGIALWLELSFLIAAIMLGAMIRNLARHHEHAFHEIENIEWPFMVLFFVLAGASFELGSVSTTAVMGVIYILCRAFGKIMGSALAASLSKAEKFTRRWSGLALLPQAGVAIGMALVAANHFPEYRQTILNLVIMTTIFFEIVGPIFTRMAVSRSHL